MVGGLAGALAACHDVDAVIAEDALEQRDVGEPRHVIENQRLLGQQRGDHQGQRGVLGAEIGMVPSSRRPPIIRIRSISTPTMRPDDLVRTASTPILNGKALIGFALCTRREAGQSNPRRRQARFLLPTPIAAEVGILRLRPRSPAPGDFPMLRAIPRRSRACSRPLACCLRRLRFSRKAADSRSPRAAHFCRFAGLWP